MNNLKEDNDELIEEIERLREELERSHSEHEKHRRRKYNVFEVIIINSGVHIPLKITNFGCLVLHNTMLIFDKNANINHHHRLTRSFRSASSARRECARKQSKLNPSVQAVYAIHQQQQPPPPLIFVRQRETT